MCLSRTSPVTSDFNHPRKGYINYFSTDVSAEMTSTQNGGQNLDQALNTTPTQIQFSPVNIPGKIDCIMN